MKAYKIYKDIDDEIITEVVFTDVKPEVKGEVLKVKNHTKKLLNKITNDKLKLCSGILTNTEISYISKLLEMERIANGI